MINGYKLVNWAIDICDLLFWMYENVLIKLSSAIHEVIKPSCSCLLSINYEWSRNVNCWFLQGKLESSGVGEMFIVLCIEVTNNCGQEELAWMQSAGGYYQENWRCKGGMLLPNTIEKSLGL